jgi:hypothetical protein
VSATVGVPGRHAAAASSLRGLAEPPAWLLAASDPSAVHAALAAGIPELAAGELRLRSVDVRRLRVAGDSWSGVYRLSLTPAGTGEERTVELRARVRPPGREPPDRPSCDVPFGAPGWRASLPALGVELETERRDTVLAALPYLTDPGDSRRLLEDSIRAASPAYAALRVERCRPEVMRYKPGSRCTVRYALEFAAEPAAGAWPTPVVAKTYNDHKGANAYAAMRALWGSPLRTSEAVRIAEPLAFLASENVLVQGPVPGEHTLKQRLRAAFEHSPPRLGTELPPLFARTGRALAELHGCGVELGEAVTFEDELAEIEELGARVTGALPQLAGEGDALLARLRVAAAAQPAGPLRPAHRSFRPAQVLVSGDEIGFIDFDGFCRAEPALDLALFRATVKDVGLRAAAGRAGEAPAPDELAVAAEALDELCEGFLEGYEAVAPVARDRVALWEALDLLTAVLHCWSKAKFEWLHQRLRVLDEHLQANGLVP